MPYSLDTEIDLTQKVNCRYYIYAPHRNNNPNKSQWTASMIEEVECFINSHTNKWIENSIISWGIILKDNSIIDLGISIFSSPLKLAKFIDSNKTGLWHGYPADYVRNSQDRPGIEVLMKWRSDGLIEKHHVTKIKRGVLCNL